VEGVWDLPRTRRWISFTVTAVLAIGAFGLLSHWQWQRAHEEDRKAQAVTAGASAPEVPIGEVLTAGDPMPVEQEWRPVRVTGTFECDHGYLVRNRPMDAQNGFWAVCPLRTADGGLLWVNRGWLAAPGPAIREVPMPPSSPGGVAVTGRLRLTQQGPPAPPSDLPSGQVTHLDTAVLTSISGLGGPAFAPYLEATAMAPADPGGLRPLPLPPSDSAQNYSYAGQWILFAVIAVGGWFYFLRREAREDAAAAATPQQESEQEPQPTG
jgi:cytochrome oxidase assembly protein ShyY1